MPAYNEQYLMKNRKCFKDDKEIYEFIQSSFPGVTATPVKGSYFSFAFCFFSHLCHPLSLNALVSVSGPFFRSSSSRVKISRLLKRGAIKTYNFMSSDKGATSAYYLTPGGSDVLFSSLPPELGVKNKIRRTGGSVPLHEYGIGLSLLQCMFREVPFTYDKEVCYSSALYKDKGSLCVDAVVFYKDKEENILYIEQDMGTEPPGTLVKKLANYNKYGLASTPNRRLVISSHSVFNYPPCLSYNTAALSELLAFLEERGADKVYEFIKQNRDKLDERLMSTVRALLVRTGICRSYNSNQKEVDAYEIKDDYRLVRNEDVPDFTLCDLSLYIESLMDGTNPYKTASYNRKQTEIAKGKMRSMADILLRRINMGQFEMEEVGVLLSGFQCYVVPSVLMSNYFDTVFLNNIDMVRHTLSAYYPSIMDAAFFDYSPTYLYKDNVALRLRNCFKLADGSRLCVEHIGSDLGGYVRGYLLRMMQIVGSNDRIRLVCICDTLAEAMDYARVLDYYRKGRELDDEGIMITFLLSEDIGKESALQVPSRLGGGGLVRVKPVCEMLPLSRDSSESEDEFLSEHSLEGLSMEELSKLLMK